MFCGFIWSPIFDFHEEILNEINSKYTVHHYFVYDFNKDKQKYEKSILDIYSTDDISLAKVKNVKLKNMFQYDLKYIYFIFEINEPVYRIKANFNTQISTKVEELKGNIRNKYKSKIKNYIHDIILHVSDNINQSSQIEKLMIPYLCFRTYEFMNLKTFLKYQFNGTIFTRVDILVRTYALKQYMKDKQYDFYLYNKMQKLRNSSNINAVKNFKKLIDSILHSGFNKKCCIEYENNYMLRNGSHRLAYLYLNHSIFIPCSTLINYKSEGKKHCNYSYKWFETKFTSDELKIIREEMDELMRYLSTSISIS